MQPPPSLLSVMLRPAAAVAAEAVAAASVATAAAAALVASTSVIPYRHNVMLAPTPLRDRLPFKSESVRES